MRTPFFLATSTVALLGALLVPACGTVATIPSDGADGASPADGASLADGSASDATGSEAAADATGATDGGPAICTGDKPRLFVNGAEVSIVQTTGKSIALDCCDSAEVSIASSTFQALLNVLWRAPGGGSTTLDLANLPPGASVELDLGCDPAQGPCGAGAEDRYTTGFQGTITHATDPSGPVVTYCLSVAEPAGSPHAVLHAIQLYAPKVPSP